MTPKTRALEKIKGSGMNKTRKSVSSFMLRKDKDDYSHLRGVHSK